MSADLKPGNELIHYGVLGMKWGVRKEADQRIASFSSHFQSVQPYATREISEKEYSALPSKPIKLGVDFNRTAFNGQAHIRNDIVYVTKTESDSVRYMAMNGPTGQERVRREQLKIKTAKEAVSPGFKERIDTFTSVLDKRVVDPTTGQNAKVKDYIAEADPTIKALNNREIGLKFYQRFAQTQHYNTPLHSVYFEELRKKGYNAVVDDADRGLMSDLPIILFPKESGAKVTEVKVVSQEDVLNARARLENPDVNLIGKIGV